MGFNLNGYVLRPARVASGNAVDSNEAVTGVDRDHIQPDDLIGLGYDPLMAPSEPVEPYADMYRAAVLEKPESRQGTEEYCVFAASTGSLSTVEDATMAIIGDGETADPIADTLTVDSGATVYEDGTLSFYIRDAGQRDITEALTITIFRGDASPPIPIVLDLVNVDPTIGKVTVSDPSDELEGGFSEDRGDSVYATSYVLGSPTFWWTRNDPDMTRFGWDGKTSRWLPLLGGAATSMGAVKPEEGYKLVPPPSRFEITETLPGTAAEPEGYALVRCGLYADADSTPLDILVVSDIDASSGVWDPAWSAYDAVVGVTSGELFLNSDFTTAEAGRTLWYNAEAHLSDADGDMGAMADFPTESNQGFPSMSPIPEHTARPFLRIGSRRYLTPIGVDQDTADSGAGMTGLPAPSAVPSGSFYWSKATGKIVLSAIDIDKCVPGASVVDGDYADYEIQFLGAHLYYDGSALNAQPLPIKAPVAALNEDGDPLDGTTASVTMQGKVWVPRAVCMPPPGISGVRWEEDGTGTTPTEAGITANAPQTRPNGSGLVRRINGAATTRIYGDTFLFSNEYAYENLDVVEYDEDLKTFRFKVPKNEVEIARMTDSAVQPSGETNASRIQFRRRPVEGEALYFRQAETIPSIYTEEARIWSRFQGKYTLVGTETIRFSIDGVVHEWDASTINPTGIAADYSAAQVAASLVADSVPVLDVEHVQVFRGRFALKSADPSAGSVEIGWNTEQADLSGHAALGLLPSWRADPMNDSFRWLPDNGAYMGMFRSPVNMDRTASTPDIRAVSRFDDTLLTSSIPANPFLTMSPPPLLDIPGYTSTSHFQVVVGLLTIDMENYQTTLDVGVVYDWPNDRLIWCEEGTTPGTQVVYPTPTLQLSNIAVFPETVSPLAMADSTFGVNLRRATDAAGQTLPASFSVPEDLTGDDITIDFLMPGDGGPGQALLVTPEGEEVAAGGKGTFNSGIAAFYDTNVADQTALYDAVEPGYLLHILGGDGEGIYTITHRAVGPGYAIFTVSPTFTATESSAQWRIYEAKERSAVDMTLLADVQQVVTNHFPDEPFKIRLLTSAGTVGGSDPLNANVVDAIASNRTISLRYGLEAGSPEATPAYLTAGANLGPVAESGLVCPDLTDPHLTLSDSGGSGVGYFQIRVGAAVFSTSAGNLTLNTGTANPGEIDVNTTTGEILINADEVSSLGGSAVYYDQLFLDPSDMATGTCEIDPISGEILIAANDAALYDGRTAYFVEQMVTENNLDVVISPLNGSLLFNKPLRDMQIVEVNYFQADTNGDKKLDDNGDPIEITEFLPLMVTLEVASYISDTEWSFNPTDRTVSDAVEEFIWVGTNLMNFAGVENATAIDGVITITDEAQTLLETDTSTEVKINYGVLEAFGGEQAYTVSSPPVYRKPFWIEAESSTFTLETDRTADFVTGLLMVLGPVPLYIESSAYDAATDLTTVTIYPTPEQEVGSRAPGRDAGLTLSDFLVSVSRGGGAGFMPLLDTAVTPLLECDKGQVTVAFYGDVRRYTKSNHLLEIDGYPYLIVDSAMSEDGYNTIVKVSTPLYKAHGNSDEVRVSVRQVYSPAPVEFAGISPFVPSEEYDLFLMGRVDASGSALPGKVLVEGLDYTVDAESGNVLFQHPTQPALQPGEYLHFRYTRLISVGPTADAGAVLYPVYRGKYLYMTTPTTENRLLGAVLKSQYTYRNQDSFYYSVQMLEEYLGEVSTISASQGVIPYSGGPAFFTLGAEDISKQGSFGLRGGAADASDQDRGARVFVEFFNGVILAFEQVLEAINGRIIGDRDGKFRFFLGHDKRYAPPGYEDAITGNLNQRVVWRDIIDAWAPASFESDGGYFRTTDPIYLPTTAEVPDPTNRPGDTDGDALVPDLFSLFTEKQRRYIKNDMDDRMLVSVKGPTFLASLFPTIDLRGNFDDMWENHRFSRLYPTQTEHFSRLFPGINYDPTAMYAGFYTPGRDIEVPGPEPGETSEQTVKTTGSPNGVVSNNALGKIPNIVEVNVQPRLPRARVWAYYPTGSAELDDALGTSTVGWATIVATPLTLGEFPIDPSTGFPDTSDMMTQANPTGSVYSLESGNPDLATPAFEVGQRVNYGKPDGSVYSLKDPDGNGIYVAQSVLEGCVLILGKSDGDPDPTFTEVSGNLIYVDGDSTDRLSTVISENDGYADTVFIGTGTGISTDAVDPATALSPDELAALVGSIPDYRIQFDLGVGKLQGDLIDRTLPTADDNFFLPLQDIFGQNPPDPLSCVEGDVQFINTDSEPLKLPCLLGENKDDSGDNQIPFMKGFPNELAVLGEVAPLLEAIYVDTGFALPYGPAYYGLPISANERQDFASVYPDEMFVGDGALYEDATYVGYPQNPATLYTDKILDKATDEGLPANAGLGDLRRFDLLFSQVNQSAEGLGLWLGATGILDVGDVVYDVVANGGGDPSGMATIEVPRFVAPTTKGELQRYTLRGFAARVEETEGGNEGLVVQPSTPLPSPQFETVLDFSGVTDMPDLSLLDNLINGVPLPPPMAGTDRNALVIRIYDPSDTAGAAFVGAITIVSGTGGFGPLSTIYFYNHSTTTVTTAVPVVAAVFDPDRITIRYDMSITPTPADPVETVLGLVTGQNYDFRLDVDTYGDSETVAVTNAILAAALYGSTTCTVLRDRLTFTEEIDPTMAKPRDYLPANGEAIELGAALNVWEFAGGLTVNECTEINDGEYLTFLNRYNTDPALYVGTYDGTRTVGALRAMSWEGHGNEVLSAEITGVTLSAASSSDLQDTVGGGGDWIISSGSYNFWDGDSDLTPVLSPSGLQPNAVLIGNRNYLLPTTTAASNGDISNIMRNDICVVTGDSSTGSADAVKTGTYLVRHAVKAGAFNTDASSQLGETAMLGARQYDDAAAPFPTAQATGPSADTDDGAGGGSSGGDSLSETNCLDLTFPTVTGYDLGAATLSIKGVVPVMRSADPALAGDNHGWETSGNRLYLVLKEQYATYSDDAGGVGVPGWIVDKDSVWSVNYTSILSYDAEEGTMTFQLDNTGTTERNAIGTSLSLADFLAAAVEGTQVSGMTYFAIKQMGSHLPENNVVGAELRDGAHDLMAGFEYVTVGNRNPNMINPYLVAGLIHGWGDDIMSSFQAGVDLVHDQVGTPTTNQLVAGVPDPVDNTEFYEDRTTPVYGMVVKTTGGHQDPIFGVCTYLQTNNWSSGAWPLSHYGGFAASLDIYDSDGNPITPETSCLLPSDRFTIGSEIDPASATASAGFYALSGVFIEPSFPRPVQDISTPFPKVTTASYDAQGGVSQIGARDFEDFGGSDPYEDVYAAIRRTRRWHDIQVDIIDLVKPLRFVYEIRRGFMSSYDTASRTLVAATGVYGTATNLGEFNNDDVNIHSGDVVRVLSDSGEVLDTAEIQRVEDETTLILRRPGLTNDAIVGDEEFEVYIEQAIVPHQQSNEQLLDLLTQEVVFTRSVPYNPADAGTEEGGEVSVVNELTDSGLVAAGTSFTDEGVQEDDYIIIDPAGDLYKEQEAGARPSGDMSVNTRPSPGPYLEGAPSKLDDNRGFYKITAVDENSAGAAPGTLMVSGDSRFTDGELFGDAAADSQYVVMPTIHGSWLTGTSGPDGEEDQQALRLTAGPVGDSYYDRPTGGVGDDGYKSIAPFGYKIIRPNSVFTQDTVELILFIRERMLSWIDEINVLWSKSGDYYIFQRDDHIEEVGSDTDTTAGLGILSNLVVDSLKGLTGDTPFANMSDCLSVLDRRFWCLDYRLDNDGYTQFATGDYSQRPVEPDLIDAVLDTDDLFRNQRYGWITFRANTTDGSIRNASREKRTLESRLQKQREALMRQKGLDKA